MLKIMEAHTSKLVLYSTINYKITPHEPHYSGNKVNQSVYDALLAEDYDRIRAILQKRIAITGSVCSVRAEYRMEIHKT